ncbi:MAG TPA: heavy metal-binding domain-containing protein [Acidimicrobiales bacterium]|nr:heavy metal-binding domain-containing protein [Acidimicrobiales bacterium]
MNVDGRLGNSPPAPIDIRAETRRAVDALHQPQPKSEAMTSDLSIDEELNLHSIGWEPVELVCGVSLFSVPMGVWNWGQGEITWASAAYANAFDGAIARIHRECAKAGGHGVVGVEVERSIHRHHIDVTLLGTAVRPVGAKRIDAKKVFVSDLSARDFTLLHVAGWEPLGLAVGASFVYAPRRSIGTVMQQKSQNVELTNFTEAMYTARESAMERMQTSAISMAGTGVVEVKVTEGPMDFARHAVGFAAWGTVVRLNAENHRLLQPSMVVPLDDPVTGFAATALRGNS